ncbi:hypothetical protein [Tersicoccus sp. Bi-70]|uniref:hypothetical protein n=1 Tax=Tersicoccus sp. Bi-70 TaxID=1897634 RepID=UPI000976205C|nr:hypothetical protein [Tersicoccus sp. Bi-70]OMH30651.1 hypothetical protein BGP79_11880 [Tersicoccus sp. Bi-70]
MAKAYRPDNAGLSRVARSSQMQAVCLDIAKQIASSANESGRSTYEAAAEKVRTGWKNEARAGAVVREKTHHVKDSLDRRLIEVTNLMARRK